MTNEYIAKTFLGLEGVLEKELQDLGAKRTKKLSRAVAFDADTALLYKANLHLRTALRILHPLDTETVKNQNQLYNFAHSINWLRWFTPKQTFAVRAKTIKAPAFNNSTFVALKVKDAIVDQFRRLGGARPSIDKNTPDILIDVIVFNDKCTISIDSSGESLHRRGYRESGHRAPLNEVLAAGMVLLSGWDINTPLIDPFCGSGTILTEAATYAYNIAPNIKREKFGFSAWKNFDAKLWEQVWLEAKVAKRDFEGTIIGSDISPKIIQHAREHVVAAGVDDCIRLSSKDFTERRIPKGPGTIIANPPYGERLTFADVEALYQAIGDKLKTDCAGYNAWLISSVKNFNRFIGLRPSKKIQLFNGGLECQYMKFEMYQGSRRTDKQK
ncbi:THUMP domain-containing protein [Aureispira sp. CCB-E]|uniref:THUMP domain-containing class I SAM-dependent RNA methyltransferase n=1 Tax=Aureispira sp. CCB-E TaxID=3051121 RepID=UPI002868A22D|nr:THUMP domain-containing protein [Aureispira sp. CCB-E]WMX15079.1 THUMP domain-containing protein [Aureispira sp. CCB-E]